MKKTILAITSCLLLAKFAPAMAESSLEFRVAAFFPMDDRFTRIYGDVGVDYQIEYSTTIFCCSCLEAWVNLDWYPKHGHVRDCGSSDIDLLNLGVGLKSSFCMCSCFYPYLGIGPSFGWVWIDNRMKCCDQCHKKKDHDSEFAVGVLVKSGLLYYFGCNLFLDLFVDYLYQPVHFHHRHVDVGGFKTGLGLGVCF